MKATGIVRRIDELGRVVIPKEIRRTLRIREGDPLEIFTDREGEVILKKYSPIGELGDFAKEYAESLQLALGMTAAVCDKDTVIAASGPCRKELMDKPIHSDLEELMDRRGRLCVGSDGGTAPHITADVCRGGDSHDNLRRGSDRRGDAAQPRRERIHRPRGAKGHGNGGEFPGEADGRLKKARHTGAWCYAMRLFD